VFGKYDLSLHLEEEGIKIEVEGKGKKRIYRRICNGEEVEKHIYAKEGNIVICPVEPVNLPKEGTAEHLLVKLIKPIIIEPDVESTFYVTFPVEIGVFLVDKRDVERIDIFTLTKPKYALYGPPESGVICRWWESDVYGEVPEIKRLFEGVLRVDAKNSYREWVEISKIVFRALDMKVFYNDHAYMHARLNILKKTVGETSFNERKPKNMQPSIDIYEAKGIKKLEKKFVAEWGLK